MKLVFTKFRKEGIGNLFEEIKVFREDDATPEVLDRMVEYWEDHTPPFDSTHESSWEIFTPTLDEFEAIKKREEKRLLACKSQLVDQIQLVGYLNEI